MTESNGRMTGASKYQPVDYNPTEIMPDATPGKYNMVISKISVKPHAEYHYPKITIIHTIESEESGIEDNQQFIGSEVMKSITLYPNNERRGNMGKEDIKLLCELTGVDISIFPLRIENPDVDLKDFFDALKGQRHPGWVTHSELPSREDPEVMRTFVNVNYKEPKNFNSLLGLADEEPEAPADTGVRRNTAPAKKGAVKTPAKRAASARR